MKWLAPFAALLLLAGCAAGGLGAGPGGRGRAGPPLPPAAEPTNVIATELAFARAAREEGQAAAYSRFAASGAQVQGDGASGRVDRWLPRQAWSSCDGSAVVVVGIGTDTAGNWRRFTRVWERQQGGDFRWAYSLTLPDPELTEARKRERAEAETLGEDAILVEAGNFIRARVADCRAPAATLATESAGGSSGQSRDRTLRWKWAASATFTAYSWNGTGWDAVHAEPVPVPGG